MKDNQQNLIQDSAPEQSPTVPPENTILNNKPKFKLPIIIAGVLILLILLGTASYAFILKPKQSSESIAQNQQNIQPTPPTTVPKIIVTDSIVNWLPEPEKVNDIHPMSIIDKYIPFNLPYCTDDGNTCNQSLTVSYEQTTSYYKVGILNSIYPKATVYLALVKNLPRGTVMKGIDTKNTIVYDNNMAFLFVKNGSSYILTDDYNSEEMLSSAGIYDQGKKTLTEKAKRIPASELGFKMDLPLNPSKYTKTLPTGQTIFTTNIETYDYTGDSLKIIHPVDFFSPNGLTKVYDFKDGNVLYANQNLSAGFDTVGHVFFPEFTLRLPTNLSAIAYENISARPAVNPAEPDTITTRITWNPSLEPPTINPPVVPTGIVSESAAKGYINGFGGCLMYQKDKFTAALSETINTSDLIEIGKTDSGGTLYDIKNKNLLIFKTMFDYEFPQPSDYNNITLEQYISYKPILIYKEVTGEYIALFREDTLPQRCYGEPVIYLYPQQKTNISVALSDKISLTESAPLYNNGWNVIAEPNGLITDLATNTLYRHLYWEGNVAENINSISDEVVAQKNIHSYFEKSLKMLGLNFQETKDFEGYWEPKLESSSYYRIIFYDADGLNKRIPLAVNPNPQTIIRVLMDHYSLNTAQLSNKPLVNYKTPTRNGFTLVEWGGILK